MTENRKYIFTDETIIHDGKRLHRIMAVRDIKTNGYGWIRKGDLGGFVQTEDNLSHEGNCWIDGQAYVYERASVENNAYVAGNAMISDSARICEKATVEGDADIYGNATVRGRADVYGGIIRGNPIVEQDATILEGACIEGNGTIVNGKATIGNKALIRKSSDYIAFGMMCDGEEIKYTAYRTEDGDVAILWSENFIVDTMREFRERITSDWEAENKDYQLELMRMIKVIDKQLGNSGRHD